MRILFLSDNFPPEVNAPASRTFEHCREWVRAGHDVTVVTCVPNFPTGRIFEGYRNWPWQVETMDGIRVIRVWSYVTANAGFLLRILDYASFMLSSTVAGGFVRRPDIVVGTSPQLFTACAAYLVSRMRRRPFVFELRDLWPESIKAVGALKNRVVIRMLERLEYFLYRRAAGIVSVTSSFKHVLARRGINGEKIAVVTNGVDLSRFRPVPRDTVLSSRLGLDGSFVVGYVGTHGMAHGLDTILDAADIVRRSPSARQIRFIFLGDGAQKVALKARAVERSLDNVVFLDSVSKNEVVRYWSLLDTAVIHLRRTELFETVIPSKLFECMGMAIPVLHGVAGESARIVEQEGVGIVFEPENAAALAAAVLRLVGADADLQRMRSACVKAAPRYDRRDLALRMLNFLQDRVSPLPEREQDETRGIHDPDLARSPRTSSDQKASDVDSSPCHGSKLRARSVKPPQDAGRDTPG